MRSKLLSFIGILVNWGAEFCKGTPIAVTDYFLKKVSKVRMSNMTEGVLACPHSSNFVSEVGDSSLG